MLNYKKIIVLGIVALAILVGVIKIRTNELSKIKSAGRTESYSSFSKGDDFSIINILSVKFR